MEAGQVGEIVDKLAEKIGVAADSLVPVAEEAMRQVVARGMLYIGMGCGLLIVTCVVGMYLWRLASGLKDVTDRPFAKGLIALCGTLFMGAWVAMVIDGLCDVIAPMLTLLKA